MDVHRNYNKITVFYSTGTQNPIVMLQLMACGITVLDLP